MRRDTIHRLLSLSCHLVHRALAGDCDYRQPALC